MDYSSYKNLEKTLNLKIHLYAVEITDGKSNIM